MIDGTVEGMLSYQVIGGTGNDSITTEVTGSLNDNAVIEADLGRAMTCSAGLLAKMSTARWMQA